mmetsp:Transcript_43999/g.60083  ORF Transcript_43999/g.60083 Transcript_43999/m.60083 type:complete len:132 (-) Transcript_43999:3123-3518(-)
MIMILAFLHLYKMLYLPNFVAMATPVCILTLMPQLLTICQREIPPISLIWLRFLGDQSLPLLRHWGAFQWNYNRRLSPPSLILEPVYVLFPKNWFVAKVYNLSLRLISPDWEMVLLSNLLAQSSPSHVKSN